MRAKSGQAVTALTMFLGVLVIGALAVLAYEINMVLLAREQLKNCVQAAAAAGAASLASSANPSDPGARQDAIDTAVNIFRENSILGQLLSSAVVLPSAASNPAAGQTGIYANFVDPVSKQVVNGGTMMQITAKFNYQPAVGQWVGLGMVVIPINTSANAGSPLLDICILYDITGSMDDQTRVTYVQRYWDYTSNPPGITYMVPPDPSGTTPTMEGKIFSMLCAPPNGLNANASFPQGMENIMNGKGPGCPVKFSEGNPATKLLRGLTNSSSPPGNYVVGYSKAGVPDTPAPAPVASPDTSAPGGAMNAGIAGYSKFGLYHAPGSKVTSAETPTGPPGPSGINNAPLVEYGDAQPDTVTDVVVNLDGSAAFGGWQNAGFDFPTIGALVEGARGNLDSAAAVKAAGVDLNALGVSGPKAGYQNAYAVLARANRQPLGTIAESTQYFLDTLNQTGNVNFSLIPFNDRCGFCQLCSFSAPQVSTLYPQGGNGTFSLGLQLFPGGSNNYANISSVLPRYDNWGNRNLALGIETAVQTLTQNQVNGISNSPRPYANKVIILVTDGVPDEKYDQSVIDPVAAAQDARDQAKVAHDAGIPIYVVAVCQDKGLAPQLDNMYNDALTNPAVGGIAGISGMGAKYYRVDWTDRKQVKSKLISVFGNIARNLVVLK